MIERHVVGLASLAIEGLQVKGYDVTSSLRADERSGIVSFRHPSIHVSEIDDRLKDAGVHVGVWRGALRVSPALYIDAGEIAALLDALP